MSEHRPRPAPRPATPATPATPVPPPAPVVVAPPPAPPAPPPAAAPTLAPTAAPAEYVGTVVAPVQIGVGVVVAAILAFVLVKLGLWPLGLVGALVVLAVSVYLATVTLTVTPRRVTIGQGRRDSSPRSIEAVEIACAAAVTLSWTQCFGIGVPATVASNRFTVRPGPALSLTLRDGDLLRVSAPDVQQALTVLGRSGPA